MGNDWCGPAVGTVRGDWSDEGPVGRCWSLYGEVGQLSWSMYQVPG